MRLLLDTSAFLWFLQGSTRVSTPAKNHIEDTNNQLFLSVASLWEMAIKTSLGRLEFSVPLADLVREQVASIGIALLNITDAHALAVAALPFHHRDPFDRLLVAQCQIENCALISPDCAFDAYGIHRVW